MAGTTSNYGLTIQGYSQTSANVLTFSSSEGTTAPKLNVTYCTPYITTSGTLSAFSTTTGTPSAAQTYTVAGYYLKTNNIVITPPTGFELSTNGTTYSSSLTLIPTSGTVAATTIYVRLTGRERWQLQRGHCSYQHKCDHSQCGRQRHSDTAWPSHHHFGEHANRFHRRGRSNFGRAELYGIRHEPDQ